MAKKTSGLGRGLGDLLEDNTPVIRAGQGSAVRKTETVSEPNTVKTSTMPSVTQPTPRPLYEERPKNRSLKANFKNFK